MTSSRTAGIRHLNTIASQGIKDRFIGLTGIGLTLIDNLRQNSKELLNLAVENVILGAAGNRHDFTNQISRYIQFFERGLQVTGDGIEMVFI